MTITAYQITMIGILQKKKKKNYVECVQKDVNQILFLFLVFFLYVLPKRKQTI